MCNLISIIPIHRRVCIAAQHPRSPASEHLFRPTKSHHFLNLLIGLAIAGQSLFICSGVYSAIGIPAFSPSQHRHTARLPPQKSPSVTLRAKNGFSIDMTSGFVSAISQAIEKYLQTFHQLAARRHSAVTILNLPRKINHTKPQNPFQVNPDNSHIFIMAIVTVSGFSARGFFIFVRNFPSPLPYAITDDR